VAANQTVGVYLFDTNGEFIKKEKYNDYLKKYFYIPNAMYDPDGVMVNMLDKTYVYPLNDDLMYILKGFTAKQGWDDPDLPTYLFKDSEGENIPGINNDIAWMFPLCYGVTE